MQHVGISSAVSVAPPPETDLPKDDQPKGDLTVRTIAMPADTNANGDIFGGWLM